MDAAFAQAVQRVDFSRANRHALFARGVGELLQSRIRAGRDPQRGHAIGLQRFEDGVDAVDDHRESSATVWTAMASPRPTASTPSLVLPLMLIASAGICSAPASDARIASACGPIFGFCAMTTI